jgi:hypothetical protein
MFLYEWERNGKPSIQWVPGVLSQGESGWAVKLTTHLHLVPRSTVADLCHHFLIRLCGVVLNLLRMYRRYLKMAQNGLKLYGSFDLSY